MPTKHKNSDPSLLVGAVEMKCHSRRIRINPVDDASGATFCEPFGSAYTAELEVFQSFGADGLETLVRPLVNTIQSCQFNPADGEAASVDNYYYRFDARLRPFPVIDAGIREYSPVTLAFEVEEGTMERSIDGTTWTAI